MISLYLESRDNMIRIIVATDKNLLIGNLDGFYGMPWHNDEDLKHFKKTTLHNTILMGSKTFQTIGKALPDRKTIVVSKKGVPYPDVQTQTSLEEILESYKKTKKDIYICGGASIYKQALPWCDEILLSRIPGNYEGSIYFPKEFQQDFTLIKKIPYETFTLEIYHRNSNI